MMRYSFVQPQNPLMPRKTILRFSLIAALLFGSLLLLHGTGRNQKDAVCRESMPCKQATPRSGSAGDMIWENLSGGFFSTNASY